MGRSAQLASLDKQIAARDAIIKTLRGEVEHYRSLVELLEGNLDRAKAELAAHEEGVEVITPVLTAATDAVGLNPEKSVRENMLVYPANMEQVDATRMQALRDAVYTMLRWANERQRGA